MGKAFNAVLLALVVTAMAVPVVASMDRLDLAIEENALAVEQAGSTPLAQLVAPRPGSDLADSAPMLLGGSASGRGRPASRPAMLICLIG